MKKFFPELFLLVVIGYLLFLIKPVWLGEPRGTFKTKNIPAEYLQLKEFIASQNGFFRTFWIPRQQRFGFFSSIHPAISAQSFVTDSSCRSPFCDLKMEMPAKWGKECFPNDRCYVRELSYFLNPKTADVLGKMGVKYIIIPFDVEGEIFIAEHKYNPQQRREVEEFLDTISWLKKIFLVDKIAIYELPEYKERFFIEESENNLIEKWTRVNPTKYLVSLKIKQAPVNLVFSETYDEFWKLKIGEEVASSQPYMGILNSFLIKKNGDLEAVVEFDGQKYVYSGMMVSATVLFLIILLFIKELTS
jgi:hypothetical protein